MANGYYKYSDCDCDFEHEHEHEVEMIKEGCELIQGNTTDIELNKCDCEVRADITVSRRKSVRIWGQVRDCKERPVACALVKLIKVIYCDGKFKFEGVAHTVTDCLGFYQFDICDCKENKNAKFKIIVSKSTIAKDRVIGNGEGICNPCNPHNDCCECK